MGDKVAVGQAYLSLLEFSLFRVIPTTQNTHISFMYHQCYAVFTVDTVNN